MNKNEYKGDNYLEASEMIIEAQETPEEVSDEYPEIKLEIKTFRVEGSPKPLNYKWRKSRWITMLGLYDIPILLFDGRINVKLPVENNQIFIFIKKFGILEYIKGIITYIFYK